MTKPEYSETYLKYDAAIDKFLDCFGESSQTSDKGLVKKIVKALAEVERAFCRDIGKGIVGEEAEIIYRKIRVAQDILTNQVYEDYALHAAQEE